MVYPQFKREKHITNIYKLFAERDRVMELILGLDEGTCNDSTCVTPIAIMGSGRAVVLDCFENDPLKVGQQSPKEQSRALYRFLMELLQKFPFLQTVQRRWIFECAEGGQMLRLQFVEDTGEECYQSAPSYIWTLAEKYLNLPAGALDNVDAIAVSFESTAKATTIDLGVKIVDATNGKRGLEAQPLNIWGHEAFRKSYVIGKSTLTNDYLTSTLGLTAENRIYPIAPKDIDNKMDMVGTPVYGADGTIIGYIPLANGPKPNGDNFQTGLKRVAMPIATPAGESFTGASVSVTLATATTGAEIYYTTDGSDPTSNSTKYSTAISITATTTLKAIAIKSGMIPSGIMTEVYTKTTA